MCIQAVARRGYPPLQGGLKLTRPQQSACSAFLALCAEVVPPHPLKESAVLAPWPPESTHWGWLWGCEPRPAA